MVKEREIVALVEVRNDIRREHARHGAWRNMML